MTKSARQGSSLMGSLLRNVKRVAVVSALLFSSTDSYSQANESVFKMRIHKNMLKQALDKNFDSILQHIEKKVERKVTLTALDATLEDLVLRISPKSRDWRRIESDLFFDQG